MFLPGLRQGPPINVGKLQPQEIHSGAGAADTAPGATAAEIWQTVLAHFPSRKSCKALDAHRAREAQLRQELDDLEKAHLTADTSTDKVTSL